MAWYALVHPGMVRRIAGAWVWASYFVPGFHPWKQEDRALIAGADDRPANSAGSAAPGGAPAAG
ncbi:MAG: hypothetical protein JWL91_161 [Sphingomonas bacterium]|nr:hypothetical protein [Sphingomonas bacterium]MDB5688285.1 hypothetical protein [Sphingomonas bacterium]